MTLARRVAPVLALALLGSASAAGAVEYRLRVASVLEPAFTHFIRTAPGDQRDAPELAALIASLDEGRLSDAVILGDRDPVAATADETPAFEAVRVEPRVVSGGPGWTELVWEGRPGQRAVFRLVLVGRQAPELKRIALQGRGPIRHLEADPIGVRSRPSKAIGVPLGVIESAASRRDVWRRWIGPRLDTAEGVAVVRGLSDSTTFPDQAFITVTQGDAPVRFTVILSWGPRGTSSSGDAQAAGVAPPGDAAAAQ